MEVSSGVFEKYTLGNVGMNSGPLEMGADATTVSSASSRSSARDVGFGPGECLSWK